MLSVALSKSGRWITGSCACPVGRNCKHAAALALAVLRQAQNDTAASDDTAAQVDTVLRQAQDDTGAAQLKALNPVLRLGTVAPGPARKNRGAMPVAELISGNETVYQRLLGYGFAPVGWPDSQHISGDRTVLEFPYGEEHRWIAFTTTIADELRDAGWRVDIDSSFPHRLVQIGAEWSADIYDGESAKWFELELGIDVDGERVSLLPVLIDALSRAGLDLTADMSALANRTEPLLGQLPNGGYVALPTDRVARVLATFASLFDGNVAGMRTGRAKIAALRAGALTDLDGFTTRWIDATTVRNLFEELTSFKDRRIELPRTFCGELRRYQHEGVAWLQMLRAHGLGGILADDMGLGKTVQLLAHVAIEHAARRLNEPVLVVAPTSVIPNWRAEIAHFVPDLPADLFVLTSYALLTRRADEYAAKDWSIVVLDEAQAIKNPRAQVTSAALRLRAEQRIALSGTPVENHLGELWSIFNCVVPGLLPDRAKFARLFRTPIEKRGDEARRRALSSRVAPFLLRRTKERVEQDLPEKTEIVQHIELSGAQRDLYETIRVAMHERVRDEIARRGLGRSRIVVLDALLKLRQVCCDPRLVDLPAAAEIHESQKLEALLEMLENLLEDGRRILLFSQFTSMLDLIKPELDKRKMPFLELRGDTRDRETPVKRFQDREVPLFLISLKAGGTGLNLTAADTVVHYDPWWNPAVERQATDRAHRIGQEQHVFVYKLIAEQTVEERILELQQRKGALAASLLDEGASEKLDLTVDDVEQLFN